MLRCTTPSLLARVAVFLFFVEFFRILTVIKEKCVTIYMKYVEWMCLYIRMEENMNEDNNYREDDNFMLYMLAGGVLLLASPVIFMLIGQLALDTPSEKLWAFFRNVVIFDIAAYIFVRLKNIRGYAKAVICGCLIILFITAFILVGVNKTFL